MNWSTKLLTREPRPTPEADRADDVGQAREEARRRDADAIARFIDGDDRALVELFDRYNHRLFSYCLQKLHDRDRAEDVTQELWERLIGMRSKGSLTPENPLGLLLTMARNLCLDHIRRRRNHAAIDEIGEASHPVGTLTELTHMEELVVLALPHLPESQREVLVLNAYSGFRFDEIAEMLGEPVGAIRTRAWRARSHLARIISAMIGVEDDREREQPNPTQRNLRKDP